MPSTALQSRISAFESISSSSSSSNVKLSQRNSTKSPPINNSLILQRPLSPSLVAHAPPVSRSPSPSPPGLGRKTSLIDLKDWIFEDGLSTPHPNGNNHFNTSSASSSPSLRSFNDRPSPPPLPSLTPLIHLESPSKNNGAKAPPLPPRKPSFASLKSVSSASSGFSNGFHHPQRSDSLTVEHTYPPILKMNTESRSRNTSGHVPASSISSFHSVSLSSDTEPSTPGSIAGFIQSFPMDHDRDTSINGSEADSISLAESFEEVSAGSLASPATERNITADWERAMSKRSPHPPKLPQRPSSSTSSSLNKKGPSLPPPPHPSSNPYSSQSLGSKSTPSSPMLRPTISPTISSSALTSLGRRVAPPPPPSRSSDRSSDRFSIQSAATSRSHASTTTTTTHRSNSNSSSILNARIRRPTPVPPAARQRYETLFNANVIQRRRFEKQREKERPALLSPSAARRSRQGWRGLSVDLITAESPVVVEREDARPDEDDASNIAVGPDERLEGEAVKRIWSQSGLDRKQLRDIWNECDTHNGGSIDRDGFVRGMWRIDEELRRTQTQVLKSASTLGLGALRPRPAAAAADPSSPVHWQKPPKAILR